MAPSQARTRMPMIGRTAERAELRAAFARVQAGRGGVIFLLGESGVGKSRLAADAADEARKREWLVAAGRAHPVERTVAYALADAFVPLLQALPPGRIEVLARGSVDQLGTLFPMLHTRTARAAVDVSSSAELYWSFVQVVRGLADERPLLLVLDDIQWADPSSLDLVHFLSRHAAEMRLAILCVVNTEDTNKSWRAVHQSLTSLGVASTIEVLPLTAPDLTDMVRQAGIPDGSVREVASDLFRRTRGNAFFAEEILKQVAEKPGSAGELPGSIREAVLARLDTLDDEIRTLVERIAVIGTRATYEVIQSVGEYAEAHLVDLLEAAQRANVIVEDTEGVALAYDFRHPLLRETVYAGLSGARKRLLHTRVAQSLDHLRGARATMYSAEIAPHLLAGDATRFGTRAITILAEAGATALARFADREADQYLSAAIDLSSNDAPAQARIDLLRNGARARQRLGRFDEAIVLLEESRALASRNAIPIANADTARRIAVALFHAGRFGDALDAYDRAIPDAIAEGDDDLLGRTYIERGALLQGIGRVQDAANDLAAALKAAERSGSPALLARAERALLVFHTLSGPAERARYHAQRAVAAAERTGDRALLGTCHWAAAVLSGMTGSSAGCALHIERGLALADELGSPILRLSIDEIAIEYAYGIGEWDHAIRVGESAIALARSLNQRALLPRLLVWTSLVYLGRDDMERAVPLIDEAWDLARLGTANNTAVRSIHSAVPAYIGRAALHMARGEFDGALAVAKDGLALVDETGYRAWAVHRILPTIAEAHLQRNEFVEAGAIGVRLRREAAILENTLGLAWADTTEALQCWLAGDLTEAIAMLQTAADALDAVPFVPDAARLRRQLAGRLADAGDRDGALRELRAVHEVFTRLGHVRELEKTRIQFRELGARPPARASGPGAAGLTSREVEIVRLVAARKSNKAIARELNVSARTVTTHLSNIFRKLAVSTRGELTDAARSLILD